MSTDFFSYKTLKIGFLKHLLNDSSGESERLHHHLYQSTTWTNTLIQYNKFNNKRRAAERRLCCSHVNSVWLHLPVPGDASLTVSLWVSEWGQTSDSDTQDQREVSRLLLDLRPHGVPVPLEGHVGGGKKTFSLVQQVVRQADAAQRHLPFPRHTAHLAQCERRATRAATDRKSGQTCWVVRLCVLYASWPY